MTFDDTNLPLLPDLRRLIERHGAWSVGLAYLRAAVARHRPAAVLDPDRLSPHLRRDIGLPPEGSGWR